jgi:hypothetical protein
MVRKTKYLTNASRHVLMKLDNNSTGRNKMYTTDNLITDMNNHFALDIHKNIASDLGREIGIGKWDRDKEPFARYVMDCLFKVNRDIHDMILGTCADIYWAEEGDTIAWERFWSVILCKNSSIGR